MNATFERSVLRGITRKDGESFESFVTRLRIQADRCQFEKDMSEQTVLQCTVAHARNDDLQRKFFDKPDLTLTEALEIACHHELTKSQLKELNRPFVSVQRVDVSPCPRSLPWSNAWLTLVRSVIRNGYSCGRAGHTRAVCHGAWPPALRTAAFQA